MGTTEDRRAGVGLWVLGGLNLLAALLTLSTLRLQGSALAWLVLSVVAGAVLIVLGFLARRGKGPAMVVAIIVLLVEWTTSSVDQLKLPVLISRAARIGGDATPPLVEVLFAQMLVRLAVALAVLVLLAMALRRRLPDGEGRPC